MAVAHYKVKTFHSQAFYVPLLLLIFWNFQPASAVNITLNATSPEKDLCAKASHDDSHHSPRTKFHIVENHFDAIETFYVVTLWLLAALAMKTAFHLIPFLANRVPESAAIITLGIILGIILRFAGVHHAHFNFDIVTFFYILLPPIVFDAGFHMPNRAFFGNIFTILMFAVVGTVFNAAAIGLTLWGICQAAGYAEAGVLECLLYGSLISAVDPVGVLSVFEEVHVNEMLYIIVFGESLLNDAVTVVLYNVFNGFVEINSQGSISGTDIVFGIISFFVVGLGGVAIGVIFGLIAALVSRFTDHVRVISPIYVFIFGYLAYLTADMVRLSGIMGAVFCGLTMKRYVMANVDEKTATVIDYSVKMLAVSCETVVFMFIGLTAVLDLTEFNFAFFFTSLVACAVYRPVGVIIQTALVNPFRTIKLTWLDQFIMSYGGLRGPIAYALCALISKDLVPARDVMLSSCIGVIFFTVYVQGATIRVLVEKLHVKTTTERELSISEKIHQRSIDQVMAGVEDIIGRHGNQYAREKWEAFDNAVLKKVLLRKSARTQESGIMKVFTELNVQDAIKRSRSGTSLNTANSDHSRPISSRSAMSHQSVSEALDLMMARHRQHGHHNAPTETADATEPTPISHEMHETLDNALVKPKTRKPDYFVKTHVPDKRPTIPHLNHETRWHIREMMSDLNRRMHRPYGNRSHGHSGNNIASRGGNGHRRHSRNGSSNTTTNSQAQLVIAEVNEHELDQLPRNNELNEPSFTLGEQSRGASAESSNKYGQLGDKSDDSVL